ncbi:chemotaxis protein CheC [Virgibacillus oceani]|uniref:CheY-P phosphatase CheC n=1 Tax=Virgibacillus oceani TaxID=1479511 RepID=A0A917H6C9_9BACI|nr:chemotaxis protein CheC [Virgibacillus oceani]GGG68862.1 CheY-P phosphatase CheC [Virgibacillus oceani]
MDFNAGFSIVQMDVLREIGNIGSGNAATSMSKLINKKIDMQVPSVNVVAFDEVMEMIGGPDKLIVALYIRIQGEAPGSVYFILTKEEAEFLVRQITDDTEFKLLDDKAPNDIAISALHEIGNILAGSYLSALSDFTGINMQPSVPSLSVDMAGAILTVGLLELSHVTDYAIVIDTKINDQSDSSGIHGQFLLLPDPESFSKIFSNLGINEHE